MCPTAQVHYTLEAVLPGEGQAGPALTAERVKQVEETLLRRRTHLNKFEAEYRQVAVSKPA